MVVDTDLAVDDLVALAFLLSSSNADVRAITVSGTGEVRCPQGLDVIRGLLAAMGDEDVPVACGSSTPLSGDRAFPTEWRDAADSAWGLALPAATAAAAEPSAVELLDTTLDPGGITLLTLGPLTNVAEALRSRPDLAERIGSIVVMGGAVDVGGNVRYGAIESPSAEWNMYVDPAAAREVVASGARIVLIGLDATNQAPISGDFLELLAVNTHTEAASLVATLLEQNPSVYTGDAYFWDPLAAAVAIDRKHLTTEEATIAVVTQGPDSGRTLRSPDGRPITMVRSVDPAWFEDLLVRTLDRLGPDAPLVTPPPPVGNAEIRYDGSGCRYEGPSAVETGRMRFTFETSEPGWAGAVARLTGELGVDRILEWIEANPDSDRRPPGIAEVVTIQGGVMYADVAPGTQVVACGSVTGTVLLAGTFAVE
jgi:inosine-uridine nucleoside N-ribohydrolase